VGLFYADKGNALVQTAGTYGNVSCKVDDTRAGYHGVGFFTGESLFRGFGTVLVPVNITNLKNIEVYASNNPQNIIVINIDQTVSQDNVVINVKGVTSGTVQVWRKDESVVYINPPVQLPNLTLTNGSFTYKFPPWSVTVFLIN